MRELKVSVEGVETQLFYFKVSPFKNGDSAETKTNYISVKSIGKLKTWPTQGAPHIFLTEDMKNLLQVYIKVCFMKPLFCNLMLIDVILSPTMCSLANSSFYS